LQSLLITDGPDGKRCVPTTTYYAFLLFKDHRGNTAVHVESDNSDPLAVSISATKTTGKLFVSLVNPKDSEAMTAECALRGVKAGRVTARILHHADRNAANTFDEPDTIAPQPHPAQIEANKLVVDLPPLSVATAVVELT
jgi:alpha-N-arabinofuranosidase